MSGTISFSFAPIGRGDKHCGDCALASNRFGHCVFCKADDAELLRPSIPVCARCARSADLRVAIVKALRKGQRDRRAVPA